MVSPLHAPGSERGETLAGAGHVSPREKLDQGGVLRLQVFIKIYCPLQKEASASLCCAQPTRNSFNWLFFSGLHFANYCNINLKAKQVRCLEALYFEKEGCCLTKRIRKDNDFPFSSFAMLRHYLMRFF